MAFFMFDKKSKVVAISSLISEDCEIGGSVTLSKSIKIDGKVTGNILTTGDVVTGAKSQIFGNITGNNIIISGGVTGDISALGRISMLSDAVVTGDISYSALEIDDTAKFTGNCALISGAGETENEGE